MTSPTAESAGKNGASWQSPQFLILIGVVALVLVGGLYFLARRYEQLPTAYGRRRGPDYAQSVNGTAVLAEMFAGAGCKVSTVNQLSPRIDRASVVVWTPHDFEMPSEKAREYFEDWLQFNTGKTLVFIGRDYDAAVKYWSDIRGTADLKQIDRVERESAFADVAYQTARARTPDGMDVEWFESKSKLPPRRIKTLSGPWAEGIDATKTEIELATRLVPPAPTKTTKPSANSIEKNNLQRTVLLQGDQEPLVTRITRSDWQNGEILVVQNGSFLLNYPLVNHEHRKLAGKLIDHCGNQGPVTFLESTSSPDIAEQISQESSNPFRILTVWPINVLLMQATVIGILYCFARAPIFGRPRTLLAESASDFGQHVAALGKLLSRSKNRDYALNRLQTYRQQVQSSKGRGRLRATDDHGQHSPKV